MSISLLKSITVAAAVGSSMLSFANPRAGMFIGYDNVESIDNFQEYAAASYFLKENPDGVIVTPDAIKDIKATDLDYIWVHIDRVGIGHGNLPAEFGNDVATGALAQFLADGGNLLLTKQATQLLHKIGRTDSKFAPGIYGDGDGGKGTDVWTIQAQIGYWFTKEDGGNDMTQFYDHRNHPIYKDLRTSGAFEWETYPMEGTSDGSEMHREDHNCMWDLNAYAYEAEGKNVVERFEAENNAVVLGQWGHVQDHAVAGIIEFMPRAISRSESDMCGTVIANGLAACEWAPREGVNAYHDNLEMLTSNCMNYLSKDNGSTDLINVVESDNADAAAEIYDIRGVRVDASALVPGFYIVRQGNKVSKTYVR